MNPHENRIYDILNIPIDYNTDFKNINSVEISKYYQWFIDVKRDRLFKLKEFIFPDKENWLEESNLKVLEFFLINTTSTVPKSKEIFEIENSQIPDHFKSLVKPDDFILDKKTISICFDLGIYLGELIIKLDNKIKWILERDSNFSNFGQPVLMKRGSSLKLNPFRIVKNLAAKVHENRFAEGELLSVFNAWKKGFKV